MKENIFIEMEVVVTLFLTYLHICTIVALPGNSKCNLKAKEERKGYIGVAKVIYINLIPLAGIRYNEG